MENNVINIDKLKVFVLEQDINYRVLNGSISVYIGKYKNDKLIKRVYITDIKENENVVGINFKSDGFIYKLLILPTLLDNGKSICSSKICLETASDDNKDKFIKFANLLFMEDTYEEKLVQHFLVMEMKESRNIYAETLANKNALYDSKAKIEHTFNNQKSYNTSQQHNASDLYFALSKVCTADKIEHVSYDKIKQFSKQDEFIEAFKKLSECSIRSISLEGKWWTDNIGSFVAFKKNSHTAVAAVFKRNKYYAFEQNQTKGRILTRNYIDTLDTQAYSVNKTLPKRSLKTIDVFKYLKSVLPVKPLIGVLVMGLVMSIVGLLLPYLNRFIYDKYIPNQDLAGVLVCAFVLFSASVGNAFINVVKTISSAAISSKVNYSLQIAFFDRVFNLKESFIKQYEPAELSKRVMGISSIFTQISVSVFATIISFLYSFVYLFQMISFMPNLTWVAVLTSFVICAVVMLFVKMQNIWYKKAIDLDIKKSSILFQILSGINKIRTTGTEGRLANLYIRLQSKCTIAGFRISMTGLLLTLFTTIFSTIASVAFYSILYMDGFNASLGSFMGFVSAFGLFSGAINQLPGLYSTYLQTKPWFTLLKPIIDQEPENSITSLEKIDLSGDIDIRHLSFSYSDNSDLILDDINLEIKKGEYVAIVGESGCGKTTLLKLLLGFEKPNSGKIFYSNHDFDSINKQVIRKNFGVVLQDGDLITGSIKDNLTAAYPQATQEEIINALKQVDLWDDVSQMPMGIHTLLSGASGLISGGQKQRILIARAIISKPKILFLDEATSSLDNVSQAHVCESLDKLGCTRVVIAHRLSTIISCDKIYVLDNGKIVQSGTYEELSNTKGKFQEFIKRQIL